MVLTLILTHGAYAKSRIGCPESRKAPLHEGTFRQYAAGESNPEPTD